ncbi:hypothetical protein Godav_003758 [Gossypium davidsonii]|uniref:HHO5-like N-terminal domain-containing protein n=2 Tax=Gossypium TaxID=3633 RepID=A0A7J8SJK6_GOSDV|nr:hypothetical protein [Gossypium davidsonii]MBA0661613.1 hypothetical protein [Gossypium klotzschianum]
MASSPYELTLDCKPLTSYSMILKSFGDQQMNDQTQKLEHVLSRLEEERLKIDAFKHRNSSSSCASPALQPLPDLTFASISKDMEENKCSKAENDNSGKASNGGLLIEQGKGSSNTIDGQTTISQPHRKARRCWSPDLHKRFVNALQMLGGHQVATTKQIRELMKVEGLTNDEVKSHLQAPYKKAKSKSTTSWTPTSQLVVLGGIWVPSEYATAVANTNSAALTLYGAHHHPAAPHLPPHFCASPVPQEFYTATTIATPALSQRLLHHQLHYKANSQAHSSPESDIKGAGNHSESIEDNKSESGDNGSGRDQRKGLAALTFGEEGEESNGCDITLKF